MCHKFRHPSFLFFLIRESFDPILIMNKQGKQKEEEGERYNLCRFSVKKVSSLEEVKIL